jgi:hypothetical protein
MLCTWHIELLAFTGYGCDARLLVHSSPFGAAMEAGVAAWHNLASHSITDGGIPLHWNQKCLLKDHASSPACLYCLHRR